ELFIANILIDKSERTNYPQWSWDVLARIFHLGTIKDKREEVISPKERAQEYVKYCNSINDEMGNDFFSTERGDTLVSIHDIEELPDIGQLQALLENRRTNRSFSQEELSLSYIMKILDETFRYREHDHTEYAKRGLYTPTKRRSSPSGGALQSCEAYLISKNVSSIESGVYHFRSHTSSLGLMSKLRQEFSFGELCSGQKFADGLSAFIVITCRFEKLMWKYKHSHAYRVSLLDAGHLSQTIHLLATALNIRTWVTGAFYDNEVRKLLGISIDSTEYPILIVGLGAGDLNPIDAYLNDY
ncbi:TPA: SagB/ThcOx family dehydrogenase, partial [Klebsiella variicola subsp. variicola]|nr:SagB/ThcOx family dehydrogenase [Klebsiella variicola subsp. variicola]